MLFTDADVHFAPGALARALAHATAERLDHLVVGPRIVGGSLAMRVMLAMFALSFALNTRPWRAREAGRKEHVGVGAFNLVRKRALEAVGFHSRIALRPDDDLKLGKLIKDADLRQDFVAGGAAVSVEWYRTLPEMVRGLEKNTFPYLDYSVPKTLAATAALLGLTLWPLLALPGAHDWTLALHAGSVALTLLLAGGTAVRIGGLSPWYALAYPLGALAMAATMLNSMGRTLAQGGVRWRGTLYPLAALKANRV